MREGLVSESDLNSHACDLRHLPIYSALEQEIAGQRHVVCGVWCVSEGRLEHGNWCDLPGSGKSCNKSNTSGADAPGYSATCSLLFRHLACASLRRRVPGRLTRE